MESTQKPPNHTIDQDVAAMLDTHPERNFAENAELRQCIEACIACSTACTACADACLAEERVNHLVRCILMNTDCADVCHTTWQLLMRQSAPDLTVLPLQVKACQAVCNRCAALCDQHAEMHAHCRVCAQVCRGCEQACAKFLATYPN